MPAVGWFQLHRVGGVWHINIIDEIVHKTNVKTDVLANMILNKKYNVLKYYGDPAGAQAQGQSGLGDIEIFRRKGIKINTKRDKVSRNIASGISHTRGFIENAVGQRFLHINENCTEIMKDLENYRYPEPKEGADLKAEPVKDGYHDHGCDMIRYFFINQFPIKNREFKMRVR